MIAFIGGGCWDTTLIIERRLQTDIVRVSNRYENPGGNALNAAACAASLGASSALITSLGTDREGDKIRGFLDQLDIETCIRPVDLTTKAFITIEPDGSRTIMVDHHQNDTELTFDMEKIINQATVIDCYPVFFGKHIDKWWSLIRHKPRALSGIYIDQEIASGRTWPIVVESAEIIERPSLRVLEALGAQLFVYTMAEKGGEWWSPATGWQKYLPRPVRGSDGDSVGAGDAFRAGLLVGIERGFAFEKSIQHAAAAGAFVASQKGSWPRGPMNF